MVEREDRNDIEAKKVSALFLKLQPKQVVIQRASLSNS